MNKHTTATKKTTAKKTRTTKSPKKTSPATATTPTTIEMPIHLRFDPLAVLEEAREAVTQMAAAFCFVEGMPEGMSNSEHCEEFNTAASGAVGAMRLLREILEHDAAQAVTQ